MREKKKELGRKRKRKSCSGREKRYKKELERKRKRYKGKAGWKERE